MNLLLCCHSLRTILLLRTLHCIMPSIATLHPLCTGAPKVTRSSRQRRVKISFLRPWGAEVNLEAPRERFKRKSLRKSPSCPCCLQCKAQLSRHRAAGRCIVHLHLHCQVAGSWYPAVTRRWGNLLCLPCSELHLSRSFWPGESSTAKGP